MDESMLFCAAVVRVFVFFYIMLFILWLTKGQDYYIELKQVKMWHSWHGPFLPPIFSHKAYGTTEVCMQPPRGLDP